jgi:hypothetical protein
MKIMCYYMKIMCYSEAIYRNEYFISEPLHSVLFGTERHGAALFQGALEPIIKKGILF